MITEELNIHQNTMLVMNILQNHHYQNFIKVSGILFAVVFGKRGTDGKIMSIRFARQMKIPFLGICFGMQLAVIEFARNVLKIKNAGSSELDTKCEPVVGLMEEWDKNGSIIKGSNMDLGGTMRLGSVSYTHLTLPTKRIV